MGDALADQERFSSLRPPALAWVELLTAEYRSSACDAVTVLLATYRNGVTPIPGMTDMPDGPTRDLLLREVVEDDLPLFFDFQLDPDANHMAAFTAKDPTDRAAFTAHWNKIRLEPTNIIRTIVCDGQVVGSVSSYVEAGKPEVTYWIGKAYWGKGIATGALATFLAEVNTVRPIYARVAKDNPGSRRVLEKCGFQVIGETKGFANARGEEIEELVLELATNGK